MKIGELARIADTSAATIRYYERIGLLPRPPRSGGNQRAYGPKDAARLGFIRRCRALGFSLDDIKAFSRIAPGSDTRGPCRAIVQRRLAKVRAQMAELSEIEARLADLLAEPATLPPGTACPRLAVLT